MSDGTGGVRDELQGRGESLRQAMRWLGERRRDEPRAPRSKLIDEAGLRFDLAPADVEFLLQHWEAP